MSYPTMPASVPVRREIYGSRRLAFWRQCRGLFWCQVSSCNAAILLHAAISACEKGEQWQQALCLLAVMQETDLVPDVITYSAAISACEKGEQLQQALGLLAVMQQTAVLQSDSAGSGSRHVAFWR